MPKINQEEYEVLKNLDDNKWKWIARNYNGALIIYTSKPMKNPNLYWDGFGKRMDDRLFQFIQWEDKEPYNIQELIEEYLYDNQPKLFIDGQEQSFEFIEESEETEVNKQNLIEKWESAIEAAEFYGKGKEDRLIEYMRDFVDDLNQLDEPEVLSEEWIDEHKKRKFFDFDEYRTEVILVEALQNLLVPKQELPVIPKFVADWIESEDYQIEELFEELKRDTLPKNVNRWLVDNRKSEENSYGSVARLFINGYTVKEEPKYYAKTKLANMQNWGNDGEDYFDGLHDDSSNEIWLMTKGSTLPRTKEEWANLGITDDNADFVEAEELEE